MSEEIRWIKGSLYKETSAGNWEPMETDAKNDAGIAYRAIQRIISSVTDEELKQAGLSEEDMESLKSAMDSLLELKKQNKLSLGQELRPKEWLDAANADGELFDEYYEYPKKSIAEAKINNVIDIKR